MEFVVQIIFLHAPFICNWPLCQAGTSCPVSDQRRIRPNAGNTCSLAAFITPQLRAGCRLRQSGHMALIPTSLRRLCLMSGSFGSLCFLLSDHIAAFFVLLQCKFPFLSSLCWAMSSLFFIFFIPALHNVFHSSPPSPSPPFSASFSSLSLIPLAFQSYRL